MRVLFAAAEAVPFAKTGGLGDVIGSLPKALSNRKNDIRIIMPRYHRMTDDVDRALTDLGTVTVPLAWRKQHCSLKATVHEGITYYFVDNDYYFGRDKLYGYDDDAERFAFFSRAVLECLPVLSFRPEIIHCHDWHTAPVSAFLRAFYSKDAFFKRIKTVLTIHNIAYQGIFSEYILEDILGLDVVGDIAAALKNDGCINYLRGGIALSDRVTTVSKTYACEILTPEYGEKLDALLREKQEKLHGIINGIDYADYDPRHDPAIAVKYRHSQDKKRRNKNVLQKELNLPVTDGVCLFAMVARLTEQKGIDLILSVLPELLDMKVQLVFLGTGDAMYEKALTDLATQAPDNLAVRIGFDESLARRVYAGSDIFLMPSRTEPCGLSQMIALRYASIPVVHATGGLKDTILPFNKDDGQGNGFSFREYTAEALLKAITEAHSFYEKPKLWQRLIRNAALSDYSWRCSAQEYIELYRSIIKQHKKDEHKI